MLTPAATLLRRRSRARGRPATALRQRRRPSSRPEQPFPRRSRGRSRRRPSEKCGNGIRAAAATSIRRRSGAVARGIYCRSTTSCPTRWEAALSQTICGSSAQPITATATRPAPHRASLPSEGPRRQRWCLPGDHPHEIRKTRGGFRGYFARLEEIAPLHETAGFRTLTIAGVEPAISADDQSYNALHGKQRDLWLDLLFEVSAEQSIVASSRHLLYVGQRADD